MKTFLTLAALGISISALAQDISWYTAEGADYYEVSHCAPGSEAAFYSSVHGGLHLLSGTIGENGTLTVPGNKNFHPQMVLNGGQGGSNQVAFTGPREFAISTPLVTGTGKTVVIAWKGAAVNDDISFQVLRSPDGAHYLPAGNISGRTGEEPAPYEFTDSWAGAATLYKIAVVSAARGLRYTTGPALLSGITGIAVFPTSVTDYFYIQLPAVADGDHYTVINNEGKMVAGGQLAGIQTAISLGRFAAGAYFVTIRCGAERKITKVIRL